MEVLVSTHPGISDDCIVSVRCGSTRRQAPLDIARCQALKFPSSLESLNEPLKIDVLKPVASARLVLHPHQDEYFMNFMDKPDMAIGLNVQSASQMPETGADAGTAGPKVGRKKGQSQGPASARDYLEVHGVLKYVQSMLTALIQAKPQDPYGFMLHQLSASTAHARQQEVQADPPKPQEELPVSPHPPPGNPSRLPSSRAGSDHQTPDPAVPAEPTEPPLAEAATQTQAAEVQPEAAAPAEASTNATAQSREDESRIRLQTVLFKASRNGVLEEILQNLFCSPACTCELDPHCFGRPCVDGHKTSPALHADVRAAAEKLGCELDVGRLSMSQLRALVRERLTNAWASGDLQKAVQEALEQSEPKFSEATAEQSIQLLQDEIKFMAEESKLLHEQVDRLSSEMQQLLLTNQQLLVQIQNGESVGKLS